MATSPARGKRSKGIVGTVIDTVKEYVNNGMNFVKEHFSGAIETVKTTVSDGFQNVVTSVQTKIGEVVDRGSRRSLVEIKDALGNLGELLKQAGKDLIQGMINGVGSMGQALEDKASGLASGAVDSIKGVLGIASPSKVLTKIGLQTGEGFVKGIDKYDAAQRRDDRPGRGARKPAPHPRRARGCPWPPILGLARADSTCTSTSRARSSATGSASPASSRRS